MCGPSSWISLTTRSIADGNEGGRLVGWMFAAIAVIDRIVEYVLLKFVAIVLLLTLRLDFFLLIRSSILCSCHCGSFPLLSCLQAIADLTL